MHQTAKTVSLFSPAGLIKARCEMFTLQRFVYISENNPENFSKSVAVLQRSTASYRPSRLPHLSSGGSIGIPGVDVKLNMNLTLSWGSYKRHKR
jgi:hypothetical protein